MCFTGNAFRLTTYQWDTIDRFTVRPHLTTYIEFSISACRNAHVALRTLDGDNKVIIYEVGIGVFNNMKSMIRYKYIYYTVLYEYISFNICKTVFTYQHLK